jgi:hypothetical protein
MINEFGFILDEEFDKALSNLTDSSVEMLKEYNHLSPIDYRYVSYVMADAIAYRLNMEALTMCSIAAVKKRENQ